MGTSVQCVVVCLRSGSEKEAFCILYKFFPIKIYLIKLYNLNSVAMLHILLTSIQVSGH